MLKMYQIRQLFSIFLVIKVITAAQTPLPTPCPNFFNYEGGPEWDRWYGIITFSSNIELIGLNYKIQLDRPAHLLVSWDGEVSSEDNINFSIFDPDHIQSAKEVVKSRIMVKYDPLGVIPSVVKIVINGNTMCSGELAYVSSNEYPNRASSSTSRYDPVFNENESSGPDHSQLSNNQNNNIYNSNTIGSNRPSNPSYSSVNEPSYQGSSSSFQHLGSGGFTNNQVPNPANTGGFNSNNPSSLNSNYPNTVVNTAGSSGSQNSGNPTYTNSGESHFPTNNQQSQWSELSQNSRNHTNQGSGGFITPVVTTLTLPNSTQNNKNNIDQIVQIIKNQLEQQQGSSSGNKTVIVALVSPVNTNSSQLNNFEDFTTLRTTITTGSSTLNSSRVRITTVIPTKQSGIKNKD